MKGLENIVFVISGVRSGTTVFRKMLNTNPDIVDMGEVFNSNNKNGWYGYLMKRCQTDPTAVYPERQKELFIDYLKGIATSERVYLLDVKYEHLGLLSDAWKPPFCPPLIVFLMNEMKARVIHLRRNPVDSVISNMVAVSRNIYHFQADETVAEGMSLVKVNPGGFEWSIKERIKATEYVSKAITQENLLEIDYEDIFEMSETGEQVFSSQVRQRIADFLSITNDFDATPALKKVINEPIESVIENFDEIALVCAKYSNYFKRNDKF